jgi:hypothetical protein
MTKQKTKSTGEEELPQAMSSSELIQAIEDLQSSVRCITIKREFNNHDIQQKVDEFAESCKLKGLSKEQILEGLDKIYEPWKSEKAEMSEELRIAAEIARNFNLRIPGCLLLAELLISGDRAITDTHCATANAELEELAIAVRSKGKAKPRGRRKSVEVKKRQRIVKANRTMKPQALQDLIEKETGIRPTITQVNNDKKRVKEKRK